MIAAVPSAPSFRIVMLVGLCVRVLDKKNHNVATGTRKGIFRRLFPLFTRKKAKLKKLQFSERTNPVFLKEIRELYGRSHILRTSPMRSA